MALQPAQPQRWDPIEGFRAPLSGDAASKELRWWSVIAIGALALAGIFALLLAISRIPGADTLFPWPVAFYEKSLIIHVVFSFVVWFMACGIIFMLVAAYRLSDGAPRLPNMGRAALAAMVVAFAMLAIPALMDRGEPSLNNYIPAILNPIYYVGLLGVVLASALAAARCCANGMARGGALEPLGATGLATAAISVIAIVAFAVSWNRLGGMPTTPADNEDLFWAGGHILQFLNTAIMIGAWVFLGGRALGAPAIPPRTAIAAVTLTAVLALGGFGLLFVAEPFSVEERELYSAYQFALAPAPTLVGLWIAARLWTHPTIDSEAARTARVTLIVSFVVFFTGGFLGLFVDGADTRTPAHYHGVIGGVNVALMGFLYLFVLPLLNRGLTRWRAARASLWLYGIGQLLHSVGLFVAGGYGAPRKVADTAPGFDDILNWAGHVGIGIGGVIAVVGGVMFIWMTGRRLLQRMP